jgi:C2 domain
MGRLEEFNLKETSPALGGVGSAGDKLTTTYDLVEQMLYLYVRVVKAKDLPAKDVTGSCDPYVEVLFYFVYFFFCSFISFLCLMLLILSCKAFHLSFCMLQPQFTIFPDMFVWCVAAQYLFA